MGDDYERDFEARVLRNFPEHGEFSAEEEETLLAVHKNEIVQVLKIDSSTNPDLSWQDQWYYCENKQGHAGFVGRDNVVRLTPNADNVTRLTVKNDDNAAFASRTSASVTNSTSDIREIGNLTCLSAFHWNNVGVSEFQSPEGLLQIACLLFAGMVWTFMSKVEFENSLYTWRTYRNLEAAFGVGFFGWVFSGLFCLLYLFRVDETLRRHYKWDYISLLIFFEMLVSIVGGLAGIVVASLAAMTTVREFEIETGERRQSISAEVSVACLFLYSVCSLGSAYFAYGSRQFAGRLAKLHQQSR